MTPTTARTQSQDGSHWYYTNGEPCYQLPKKDGTGMKTTTLADARKLNLLPSVTTILRILDKPELNHWKTEQALLAALTTPTKAEECGPVCPNCGHAQLLHHDAFMFRVLHAEKVQDEEMEKARNLGTDCHAALESLAMGKEPENKELLPWVTPAWEFVRSLGVIRSAETVVIGKGYAGKCDLIISPAPDEVLVIDYKTTGKLPDKGPWLEHRCQLAAYSAPQVAGLVRAGNLYVSTKDQGDFIWHEHTDVRNTFEKAFLPILAFWQWANQYFPKQ